jgi:hypothetical protein
MLIYARSPTQRGKGELGCLSDGHQDGHYRLHELDRPHCTKERCSHGANTKGERLVVVDR